MKTILVAILAGLTLTAVQAAPEVSPAPSPTSASTTARRQANAGTRAAARKRPATTSYISPRVRPQASDGPWSTPLFQQIRSIR